MKIHHLNCGTLIPKLVNIKSLVYCLLVETSQGLVLIDTGFGSRDYTDPNLKMRFFLSWMGVPRLQEETATSQIKALGYNPNDVKHVIQTHLHIDHAGGLVDFPWANVHVYQKEFEAIQNPRGPMEFAYVQVHWAHGPKWIIHNETGENWFGLSAIRVLKTQEADFYLIPLTGHTRGHCGVAIGKPGNWLLHCGDAASPYHSKGDLHDRDESAYCLRLFPEKLTNQLLGGHVPKVRAVLLDHKHEIKSISAHDSFSFKENTRD